MSETYWDLSGTHFGNYGDSIDHPSRRWLAEVVVGTESVLQIGCGSGKEYLNLILNHGKPGLFRAYDSSHKFIEACQEMYPEADFRVGDAHSLPEQYCSWDTIVCRHILEHVRDWRVAMKEAFRIARKRVIIILWRPLTAPSEGRKDYGNEGYCWDFHRETFIEYMKSLTPDIDEVEIPGPPRDNWAFTLWKNDIIFDLDDFCDEGLDGQGSRFEILQELKAQFPLLKVTLFTVPGKSTVAYLNRIAQLDWVELAVHGQHHNDNWECAQWDCKRTEEALDFAEATGCFVKGFRAPGWNLNPQVCEALKGRGYWLACHLDHANEVGKDLSPPIYWSHHPWMLHGHMQNIQGNILSQNGIEQLYEAGPPFHEGTRFHFISEFLEKQLG